MRVIVARSITYTVVGLVGAAAIAFTPPLPPPGQVPGVAVSGRSVAGGFSLLGEEPSVRPLDLAAGASPVAPVVVLADSRPRVDTLALAGTIISSLYRALDGIESGGLPRSERLGLAWSLADIFEYRVDMSRDLRQGDRFGIVVERVEQPDGRIAVSKILGAHLALSGEQIEAIRFNSRHATGQYFDAGGKSLRAAFLRAPLSFRRISSRFGIRYHPILGYWRRHAGTDYAASMGTPVRCIGNGVVVFAGRKGGYGNVIDVKHRNGYVSRYGHLRNFARGMTRGRRIDIGQTIAYVGQSGLATGPHLHFEVLVSGVQRNPRIALRMKGGEPIAGSERGAFQSTRRRTLSALRSFSAAATGD